MEQWTLTRFSNTLSQREPTPGGGGAAAYVGSLGAALGQMAIALTVGKKQYASVEPQLNEAGEQLDTLRGHLLACVEADAQAFLPLQQAMGLKAADEGEKAQKATAVQAALKVAIAPPLTMLALCAQAAALLQSLAPVVSRWVVSDVGCGAALCEASLQAAYLNVLINANMMDEQDEACALVTSAQALRTQGTTACREAYAAVEAQLWPEN